MPAAKKTARKAAQPRPPRQRIRYSIAEWYGRSIDKIPAAERVDMAKREVEIDGLTGIQCPFMLRPCNKAGGVCSIQPYRAVETDPITLISPPVCVCPNRFSEAGAVFPWVGSTLLGTSGPIALGEIGFLDRFRPETAEERAEGTDLIGRIDCVLIHPEKTPIEWAALEIQAVYFSGNSMMKEFKAIAAGSGDLSFPAAQRRPDWRSSGPKRLLPQLQTKVPTISRWGKKTAVVIDRPFFEQLVGLTRETSLSNSEIVWFVMDYEACDRGWKMVPGEAVMTTLETSVKALTGGKPLSKEAFERVLLGKLRRENPDHPLSLQPPQIPADQ